MKYAIVALKNYFFGKSLNTVEQTAHEESSKAGKFHVNQNPTIFRVYFSIFVLPLSFIMLMVS